MYLLKNPGRVAANGAGVEADAREGQLGDGQLGSPERIFFGDVGKRSGEERFEGLRKRAAFRQADPHLVRSLTLSVPEKNAKHLPKKTLAVLLPQH
jgi:hypothetical protein